ncbi:hypothetical protein B7P43_G06987 [Cryptotermes secundus]|uniref:Uncharacterized protein n=1 Tax=Cryptotermes secundus TaxID=105785 RepID=A0A2J7Q8X6_9NEOP|nr:hypothetical protein B7P43_G06987 [Cryptotermes secundus]
MLIACNFSLFIGCDVEVPASVDKLWCRDFSEFGYLIYLMGVRSGEQNVLVERETVDIRL